MTTKKSTIDKALESGAPANAVDVKIEPAKSTVKGAKPKEHKEKAVKKEAKPVVSSVAQLRETAKAAGQTVSTKQVADARAAEEKTAEEGGKLHRPAASER